MLSPLSPLVDFRIFLVSGLAFIVLLELLSGPKPIISLGLHLKHCSGCTRAGQASNASGFNQTNSFVTPHKCRARSMLHFDPEVG